MVNPFGFITLQRKILDWEWYKDLNTKSLFIHLILRANHSPSKYQGTDIDRGQVLTGRHALSNELGISEQSIRTSLKRLKSTNEITIKPSNKNSLITIVNYDLYQLKKETNQQANHELTSNQPATNQQLTTNNNVKKNNNIKNKNISIYTVDESFSLFDKSSLNGRFFSKMNQIYGLNENIIQDEFKKWKEVNQGNNFESESHLQNSFNNWLRNYKPKSKTVTNKLGKKVNWDEI